MDNLQTHQGDILTVEKGIIVQGCNCQGKMNSGIAKNIREKWPSIVRAYTHLQTTRGLILGDIQAITSTLLKRDFVATGFYAIKDLPNDVILVNAMTQEFPRKDKNDTETVYVDYDAVEAAFLRVRILAKRLNLPVHFPKIGAGLANGDWDIILPLIIKSLGPDVEKHLWILPE